MQKAIAAIDVGPIRQSELDTIRSATQYQLYVDPRRWRSQSGSDAQERRVTNATAAMLAPMSTLNRHKCP